jgi:hypothetical protein
VGHPVARPLTGIWLFPPEEKAQENRENDAHYDGRREREVKRHAILFEVKIPWQLPYERQLWREQHKDADHRQDHACKNHYFAQTLNFHIDTLAYSQPSINYILPRRKSRSGAIFGALARPKTPADFRQF